MAKTSSSTPPASTVGEIDPAVTDTPITDSTVQDTPSEPVVDIPAETPETAAEPTPEGDATSTPEIDTPAETPEPVTTPEPVVAAEPTVTPEPVQAPAAVPANTAPEKQPMTLNEIDKLLTDNKLSVDEKFATILADGPLEFKTLISKLIAYNADMGRGTPMLPEKICAGRNYDLYTTLVGVVNTDMYMLFRVKFDIINMAFNHYSKDAFHEVRLHRFDNLWTQGAERLKTYQALVTSIALLADKAARKDNIKKINFKHAFSKNKTVLGDKAISNLIKYYTM